MDWLRRLATASFLAGSCAWGQADRIDTYVRIEGESPAIVRGIGLVTGLPGTGDSGKDMVLARPLARLLEISGNPVDIEDLAKSKSVAVVMVQCAVPASGGRPGDRHDVTVTALHSAKSLVGGELLVSPLLGPLPGDGVYAMAGGALVIEDPESPTRARVRNGAQVTRRLPGPTLGNSFNLILESPYAGRSASSAIAGAINRDYYQTPDPDGPVIATALDDRTIRIDVPEPERADTNGFIGLILSFRLPPSELGLPPRVVVNQASGTVVFTSDVRISASAIADDELTITTITPAIPPTPESPLVERTNALAIRPSGITEQEDMRLSDLIAALKQLNVPVKKQIQMLEMLAKAGQLHAELVIE